MRFPHYIYELTTNNRWAEAVPWPQHWPLIKVLSMKITENMKKVWFWANLFTILTDLDKNSFLPVLRCLSKCLPICLSIGLSVSAYQSNAKNLIKKFAFCNSIINPNISSVARGESGLPGWIGTLGLNWKRQNVSLSLPARARYPDSTQKSRFTPRDGRWLIPDNQIILFLA